MLDELLTLEEIAAGSGESLPKLRWLAEEGVVPGLISGRSEGGRPRHAVYRPAFERVRGPLDAYRLREYQERQPERRRWWETKKHAALVAERVEVLRQRLGGGNAW